MGFPIGTTSDDPRYAKPPECTLLFSTGTQRSPTAVLRAWRSGTTLHTEPMRCLPTPRAVEVLGRSKLTLLRYARDGHLTPGVHFFRGPYQNSPITWDVERCQQRFAELARMPAPLPKGMARSAEGRRRS